MKLTTVQEALLRQRLWGMCSGVFMGDTLGFPWECLSREEILTLTGGTGVESVHTSFAPRILGKWGDRLAYQHSDDWRQTVAVGRALMRSAREGIDLRRASLDEHLIAMREDTTGWGPTTIDGLKELELGLLTDGRKGRRYDVPVMPNEKNQSGTGPLMKASSLAVHLLIHQLSGEYSLDTARRSLRDVYQLGRMTHAGEAVTVTLPYAILLAQVLDPRQGNEEPRFLRAHLTHWSEALSTSHRVVDEESFADLLTENAHLGVATKSLEALRPGLCDFARGHGHESSWLLAVRLYQAHMSKVLPYACEPHTIKMTGARFAFWVAQHFATFHATSLPEAVLGAVNVGGDTDTNTNACITGAYAGALFGWSVNLPDWWRERD